MRFIYLLLVAATVLLSSPVVGAKQSTVAEADTQPNSIDVGDSKRFLRSNKWIDDDSTGYAENEERGTTGRAPIRSKTGQVKGGQSLHHSPHG
ncbi:hypothetical protein PI124_g18644 [Phytophthora idaei]|nr:hypothetical protein PI126_g17943 [Phytophthora idaei]KAG3236347.1 hypothetical protein PI124_g18644 [Phytophthora idaei]